MKRGIPATALLLVILGGRLAAQSGRPDDKFIKIYLPSGSSVTAELAITDAERARGLMFRERLLPDQGMLFVFERESAAAFWMQSTSCRLQCRAFKSVVSCAFGKRAKCFLGEIGQRGGLPGSVGATSTGIRVGFAAGVTLSRQA